MPFIQRFVDPTHVSQVEVDRSVTNELECVTNHSLANIIRQLSSLSKHAEDMFSELYQETSTFFNRASQLNSRVEHLRITVTQLNPTEEVVSLQDIHLRKPYRSSNLHDQQVVSRVTMTQAIQDMYLKCEKPPALDKLNTYREDGKDCMKFYTDPSYFFELWYSEIKKDIDNKKNILRKKRDKKQRSPGGKQVKPKTITSKVDKFKDQAMGKEFESGYNEPVISRTDKPIPPGYTRQNSGQRPENLDVQNGGQYGQTHVPDHTSNHVDKQAMNGPYVISETQDPNYSSNQRQSQSMRRPSAQQNQNQSPRDRRTAPSQRVSNIASPNRPVVPPPPPPPDQLGSLQRNDRASMSPQRESLPPPPLPPPLTNNYSQSPQMMRNAQFQNVNQNTPGGSPVRQMSPQRDQDLPPPPPPPPLETPDSPNVPPPPPPMLQNSMVPPPPPPPPPPPAPVAPPVFMNGQMGDTVSVSSNNSTTTYSSTASAKEVEPPPQPVAETGRNALLEEIRLGNKKLKRTDERKQDAAPPDRFDVHAVMTRAFDMRRRVIEDSESEDEDSEDEWDVAE